MAFRKEKKPVNLYHLLMLMLLPGVLLIPLLWLDNAVFAGHTDVLFYSNILSMVQANLAEGNFWPRWLAEANAGLGAPVLYVFPPLPYILTSLADLALISVGIPLYIQYLFGMLVAIGLFSISTYLWLRRHFPVRAAFAGAALAALMPYYLVIIYLHGNLAQLWALVWLPLWLVSAEKIAQKLNIRAIAGFGACSALVLLCHPLTLLAFGIIPLAYGIYLGRHRLKTTTYHLFLGTVLGASLTAFHWVSMLQALHWFKVEGFLEERFNILNNLNHTDIIYLAPYAAAAILALSTFYQRPPQERDTRIIFWSATIALMAVLMTSLSYYLWKYFPGAAYIQFPAARLHPAALLGGCFLLASVYTIAPRKSLLIVAAALAVTGIGLPRIYTQYQSGKEIKWEYIEKIHTTQILPLAEHFPITTTLDGKSIYEDIKDYRDMPLAQISKGKAKIKSAIRNSQIIDVIIKVRSQQANIRIKQLYIPAWEAYETDTGKDVRVYAGQERGLIELNLTRGEHKIRLSLKALARERFAKLISFYAFITCLLLFLYHPKRTGYYRYE